MHLTYKDRAGGTWREYRNTPHKRATIAQQYSELQHVGNIIIGTVRGNRITRRAVRGY